VALARPAAGEVGALTRIAGEGGVDHGGGVGARRVAAGERRGPVGALVVEVGQLLEQEPRPEPLAQLLYDDVGGQLEVGTCGLGGLGEAPVAVQPLEESVLEGVGQAYECSARVRGREPPVEISPRPRPRRQALRRLG
jgi:hypothetical protein